MPHFEIIAKTGISKAQIYKLREKALLRGWDPKVSSIVEVSYIEDSSCSRRPKTPKNVINLILEIVTKNSTTRGYSYTRIASEVYSKLNLSISSKTIYNILKENSYSSYKRTIKLRLKDEDKER